MLTEEQYIVFFLHNAVIQLLTSASILFLPFHFGSLISFTTYGRAPCTSDRLVARAVPTEQHNIERSRTNIRALTGIRTRDPVYELSRSTPRTARPLDGPVYCLLYLKGILFGVL
jgi:hypothetical protein